MDNQLSLENVFESANDSTTEQIVYADGTIDNYELKRMYCKTHEKTLDSYQIPLDHIDTEGMNPARLNDCPEDNVNTIADSLSVKGQDHPISVEWSQDKGCWEIVFGCNRVRGSLRVSQVEDYKNGIPYVKDQHIWATVFTGDAEEKNDLQIKENFEDKNPEVAGTKDDLVMMIAARIDMGSLDDDRETVLKYITKRAPQFAGRKFKGFWNALQKNSQTLGAKFKTWDKGQLSIWFANNNNIGLNVKTKYCEETKRNIPVAYDSGHVVELDGKKIAIYFSTQSSEIAGALPTNATKKKFLKDGVDEVWIVGAINGGATSGTIAQKRKGFEKKVGEWNTIVSTFHKVIWAPQSDSEQKTLLTAGLSAREHTF